MTGPQARQPTGPQRTCIGCRVRADRSQLLRVVAVGEVGAAPAVRVVPDVAARLPGRGAWVHHDLACLDLATRRRAFSRALRVQGPVDTAAVQQQLAAPPPPSTSSGSGSAPDGHPMSSSR